MILGLFLGIYALGVLLMLWLGVDDLYELIWAFFWPVGIVIALADSLIDNFRK